MAGLVLALPAAGEATSVAPPRDPPASSAGLPPFESTNPGELSHSPLGFQPFAMPRDTWSLGANLEYGSEVELFQTERVRYDFDGEVLRLDLRIVRKLDERTFAQMKWGVMGAYAGFLDGAIDAYHSLFGISYAARALRPKNQFEYGFRGGSVDASFSPIAMRPLDPELGVGRLFGSHLQVYGALTFPGGAPEGYGRGVVTLSLRATARYRLASWLLTEGSLGVAYAPPSGPLSRWQSPLLAMGTLGARVDLGRHAIYGNLLLHSAPAGRGEAPYRPLATLDGALDFGYRHTFAGGEGFWVGLTEDLIAAGPAVDVVLHTGLSLDL